jgi:hypothetical protein
MATPHRAMAIVISIALFSPLLTQAQTTSAPPAGQPRNFDAAKQHRLEELAKHIGELQRAQTCVQNSTDFDQMEGCRPPHRQR